LGKSTKQAYPGTVPPAEILGFVRYFITAVCLYLCFGHFSAAALASAHFFLLKNTLILCMGLLKRTDEGTKFQSAAVAPMSGASCAGDGEGRVVVRLPSSSGGDSFQLPPESSFIMFYRILQRAMRSITISNTIRNQHTG
jgi:hypothetical protein